MKGKGGLKYRQTGGVFCVFFTDQGQTCQKCRLLFKTPQRYSCTKHISTTSLLPDVIKCVLMDTSEIGTIITVYKCVLD